MSSYILLRAGIKFEFLPTMILFKHYCRVVRRSFLQLCKKKKKKLGREQDLMCILNCMLMVLFYIFITTEIYLYSHSSGEETHGHTQLHTIRKKRKKEMGDEGWIYLYLT